MIHTGVLWPVWAVQLGMTQNRRQKRRQRQALEWLARVALSAQARLDAGDLDFDDVLYRGRDASLVLLDIFGGDESSPHNPTSMTGTASNRTQVEDHPPFGRGVK